mgnify:FL=1
MKTRKIVSIWSGIAVLALAGVAYVYLHPPSAQQTRAIFPSDLNSDTVYVSLPLTKNYKNDTYHFSLSMPEDFSVQELPADDTGGKAIVLQNSKGDGVQILVTPYSDDTRDLTADDVRASIPDMEVRDEQPVEIGSDYTGVAFMSDNDAFGGASREVWFVYPECNRGVCKPQLYQISTYAHLDSLLQAMFGTWKFF